MGELVEVRVGSEIGSDVGVLVEIEFVKAVEDGVGSLLDASAGSGNFGVTVGIGV